MRRQQVDSFPAHDAAGKKYTVCVSEDIIEASNCETEQEVTHVTYLTVGTIDGERLNHIAKGVYETLLGLRLRSSDPRAR